MHRLEQSAGEVRRLVAMHVANREHAADISRQALLLAGANLHTLRGKNLREFRAWVFTIRPMLE